ncbi:hypothetical protein D7V95_00975 [bacterium J10(2018)]|nr:hypothetical protein D7V95_00975 [bacterium J10(2018)]
MTARGGRYSSAGASITGDER